MINQRGIPANIFFFIQRYNKPAFTAILKIQDRKNPITMVSDAISVATGRFIRRKQIASKKQMLQMKAARLSILNKAMVQKPKFLHKIALFCLINHFY
jgi:hypothetical protein